MAFYNVPTPGAATKTEALREFARRNTPEGRDKLTEAQFERIQERLQGVCYQGDGGHEVYLTWAELSAADLSIIRE